MSVLSAYALRHRVSCSPEIERRLLVTPLTLCLTLQKKKKKHKVTHHQINYLSCVLGFFDIQNVHDTKPLSPLLKSTRLLK